MTAKKQLKSIRTSIVEVQDNQNTPIAYFLYVDGKLQEDWTFDELSNLANTLPVECLNEYQLRQLMPEDEKDFF